MIKKYLAAYNCCAIRAVFGVQNAFSVSSRLRPFRSEEKVKTMKTSVFLRLLLLIAGLLAGASLASAQSQIILGGGSQGVTFDATSATSAQVTFGNCNGSNCSLSGLGVVTNARGWAVSLGSWSLVLNSGNPLSVSNTGAFNGSPTGTFTFKGGLGMTGTIGGTFTITSVGGSANPQFNLTVTNLTGTGSLASLFPQGSSADLNYMLSQLLCSSSVNGGCTFQNLFNHDGVTAWAGGTYGRLTPAPEPTAAFLLGT
jgi:hypothetical protein